MQIKIWFIIPLFLITCKTSQQVHRTEEFRKIAVLEKSGCFGTCPVYTITVLSNKILLFTGHAHVAVTGEHKDTLSDIEFQKIAIAISNDKFQALDSVYMEPIMDIPTTHLVTWAKNNTKRISCNVDPPEAFKQVEEALTVPANKRGWLKNGISSHDKEEIEWIIDLIDANSADILPEKYPHFNLLLVKRISPTLPYFLYRMRLPDDWSSEQVRAILLSDPLIREAELNKKLERR